jgi:hypothetical protein
MSAHASSVMAAEAFARMRWTTFALAPAEIARIAAVPEVVKVNRVGIAGSVSRARLRANANYSYRCAERPTH